MIKKPTKVGLNDPLAVRSIQSQLKQQSIIANGRKSLYDSKEINPYTTVAATANTVTTTTSTATNLASDTTTVYATPGNIYVSSINQTIRNTTGTIGVTSIIEGNNISITSTGPNGTGDVTINSTGGGGTGTSGYSGISGYSGATGTGTSGYSGYSGATGTSGYSGISGYSGGISPTNQLIIEAPVTDYQLNLLGGNVYIDPYTNYYLECTSVTTDSGGNIFLYGVNNGDFSAPLLSKYNSAGTLQWQKYFDESVSNFDIDIGGMGICDNSGNVLLVYFNYLTECYNVIKVSTTGTLLWQRQINSPGGYVNTYNITTDSSDNVFLVFSGANYHNLYSVKYDSSGTLQWQNRLDTYPTWNGSIGSNGMCTDSSGNLYFVATNEYDSMFPNSLLVKYDSSGTLIYANQIDNFKINGITVDSSNNIYLAGRRFIDVFTTRGLVVKLNSVGSQIWTTYFNQNNGAFIGISCKVYGTSLYVFGSDSASIWSYKGYILEMSTTTGDVIWQNLITQPNNGNYSKPYPIFFDASVYSINGTLAVNSNGILIAATMLGGSASSIADMAYFNLPLNGTGLGVYDLFSYTPTIFDYVDTGITLVIADSGITSSTSSLTTGSTAVSVTTPTYSTFQDFLFPSGTRTFTLNANSIMTFPDGTLQYSAFNPYLPNLYVGSPTVDSITTTGNSIRIGYADTDGSDTLVGQGSIGIGANINTTATLNSIAIGENVLNALSSNANNTVAIGHYAAHNGTSSSVVAIGHYAGYDLTGANAVVIGNFAGEHTAGNNSISIGTYSGRNDLGLNSIAIGSNAAYTGGSMANVICINATGANLDPIDSDSFYVKPIRQSYNGDDSNFTLRYDDTSGEISRVYDGVLKTAEYVIDFTLEETDSGKYFYRNSVSSGLIIVTVPDFGSTPYFVPNGATFDFINLGSGTTRLDPQSSGVNIYLAGNSSVATAGVIIGAYGWARLVKITNNDWFVNGQVLTAVTP